MYEDVGVRQKMGAISLAKSKSFSFEVIKDNVLSLYKEYVIAKIFINKNYIE